MVGQAVARGAPINNVVELQRLLGRISMGHTDKEKRLEAEWLLYNLIVCLDLKKTEKKVFKSLMKAVIARGNSVDEPCRIWRTKRVHRMLFNFVTSLSGDPGKRLADALDLLEVKINEAIQRARPVAKRRIAF